MSLVVGVSIAGAVVFGCDGFALIESKNKANVKKLYTRTKLVVLHPWNIVVGYVGETEALLDIISPIVPTGGLEALEHGSLAVASTQGLTEEKFLAHVGREMHRLHRHTKKTHILLVCGYCDQYGYPVQFCFDRDGKRRKISEFICIGSGAGIASRIIGKAYSTLLSMERGCRLVIDAIYAASVVPTVNSLPMIVVARKNTIHDFTAVTKEEYRKFRESLRNMLIQKARAIVD